MAFGKTFADKPVKTSRLPAFRAEHFPNSGPYPLLDRTDALDHINARLGRGELSGAGAFLCRKWASDCATIQERCGFWRERVGRPAVFEV